MNIGRYEVINELGTGGMAIVYLARDPYIKRQVAVKVLPRQFTFDPQFRARFQHEAEVIAALENDAIVPVYDFGDHEDQPFIVMRYMAGGTLSDRMSRGPLPVTEVAPLFQRIGSALDYAHKRGVIHRDIKPGNILFDAQGEASLSDFGIAKLSEANAAFTGTGHMVGTPAYMSPEQARGEKDLDGRCDVYSLGVVLFEVLSGQLPFIADTPMGVAIAHIQAPVPSLLERQPSLPVEFEAIIRKALEKDPAKRFQTASELARAILDREKKETPKTVLEMPAAMATMHEASSAKTALRPQNVYSPPAATRVHTSPLPQPVAKKSSSLPKILGLGSAAFLALCLCVGVIGSFASGLIPNPFAKAENQPATEPTLSLPAEIESTEAVFIDATPTASPLTEATQANTINIAAEGSVDASSVYDSNFSPSLVLDGDLSTSWLSAGPDADGTISFAWTGIQEDYIASIELISNRENQNVDVQTGHGFGEVTIQVYTNADELVFEETVNLDGTPDPDVYVTPNVVGRWLFIVFTGSESREFDGFAELKIGVIR